MASRSVFLAVYNLYGVDRSGDVASAWLDKSWERRVEFLKSNIHLRKTRSLFDDRTPTAAHQSIPAPPPQHTHTHTHTQLFSDFTTFKQARGNHFSTGGRGVKVKNQVYHATWYVDFHPVRGWANDRSYYSCYAVCEYRHVVFKVFELDRRSLPLLWQLSDISAICNFWHQLQILWGESADPWPCLPEPLLSRSHRTIQNRTEYETQKLDSCQINR